MLGRLAGVLLLAKPEATDRTNGPVLLEGGSVPRTGARLRLLLCGILVLLGAAVMVGWLRNIPLLTSIAPGMSTMKFNTALGFVVAGIGFALAGASNRWARFGGTICAFFVLVLGAATLIEYGLGIDLRIDQAVVPDTGTLRGSGFPGRMSILTATAWTILGIAMLLLAIATRRTEVILAHSLAMAAGAIAVLAAGGYAFGAEAFWAIGNYTFIAGHTAAGILIAAATALMTRAREGWLQPYADSPAALALLIRLLPFALGLPTLVGLLIMLGAGLGAYNAPYGFALFIPVTSVAMVLTALWVASKQRDAEQVRLRYERHLQLVVAELNHRVKNTLSIVQSFAHQSLKSGSSPREAGSAFEGRLTALASAHAVLTRENWDNVSLLELVANSLHAHNDSGTRFAVEGQDMPVSPKTAITLAMTLHELATNSTKYGALSVPDGYVRVSWGNEDGRFHLQWKDVDGPPVRDPQRSGFGSRMLTRALASELGGKAELRFESNGARYQITAPARAQL